jgi:23S rRNA pseudouridine1911/1915/1917 synthase
MLQYIVLEEDAGLELKRIAKKCFQMSNRLFNKLKLNHHIYINGKVAYANDKVKAGDIISCDFDYPDEDYIMPEKGDLSILYEDDWYLAVDKPQGIVVHPCAYHQNGTMANFVKYYLNNDKCIRPVNRLDKDTSGILLFAKNEYAQERFNQLNKDDVQKIYIAIVDGILDQKEGKIEAPIARKEGSIIERCVDFESGQQAITHYKVIEEFKIDDHQYTKLEVVLETGRTHQIRVHMSYIGHPIAGDTLYNKADSNFDSQQLTAYKLEFKHPITRS